MEGATFIPPDLLLVPLTPNEGCLCYLTLNGFKNMALHFQSIRSSSKGNCLAVFTETTRILIDIGLSSMKRTRSSVAEVYDSIDDVDAVIVSHAHGDHISYYPLRVLANAGIELMVHHRCAEQLKQKHFTGPGLNDLRMSTFDTESFVVGDITIEPFEVSHNPYYPTFGFSITNGDSKIVIATDLNRYDNIIDRFVDADFIFIEANHNLELLKEYYNPNSAYHLPNPAVAELLEDVCKRNSKRLREVMLGHISPQRNTPTLAVREVSAHLGRNKRKMEFNLTAAPLNSCGHKVTI